MLDKQDALSTVPTTIGVLIFLLLYLLILAKVLFYAHGCDVAGLFRVVFCKMRFSKKIRNDVLAIATFWKRYVTREGVKLSLRGASPRVRYSLFKNYEADDIRLCRVLLSRDDKVLELGSSIGFLAIYCMKNIGISNYASVEANPMLRDIMAENFKANNVPFPHYLNAAAGPVDGTVSFNVNKDYYSSSLKVEGDITIDVQQKTIPTIIDSLGFKPNALIMDIEGGEIDIPLNHLCLFDKIIAEFHGRMVGEDKIDAIIEGLENSGYRLIAQEGPSMAFMRDKALAPA